MTAPTMPATPVLPLPGHGRPGNRVARLSTSLPVLGPALVAAVAYVDPGNFATNFAAGAGTGYRLMWVVLAANLIAMPIQYLSAKVGIVTGASIPALCRRALPRPVTWALWLQAELVAMATDLAEFVGAAVGLNLLFGLPLPASGAVTAVLAYGVLALQRRGHRPFELAIAAGLALVGIGFLYQTVRIGPSVPGSFAGLRPSFGGSDSVLLAVGIVGATVMPHAIYLHSGLTGGRAANAGTGTRQLLRLQRWDIGLAMTAAGLVNLSMLAVAAKLFHTGAGHQLGLAAVHTGLGRMVGGGAALAFAIALLVSGISSAGVGTFAGQVVMDGFLRVRMPLWLRRSVTMVPALVVLFSSVEPARALVLSQVALSFGIPFALLALLGITRSRSLMGEFVNSRPATAALCGAVVLLSGLNVVLLVQQLTS